MSDHDVTPMVLSSITADGVNKVCTKEKNECVYTNQTVTDGFDGKKCMFCVAY